MTVIILGLNKIRPVSMLVDKGQNFLENTKPVYGFQLKLRRKVPDKNDMERETEREREREKRRGRTQCMPWNTMMPAAIR